MNIYSIGVPSGDVTIIPITMLFRSAVLNTEGLRIHSSFKDSQSDLISATSEYGNPPEHTSSYSSKWGVN